MKAKETRLHMPYATQRHKKDLKEFIRIGKKNPSTLLQLTLRSPTVKSAKYTYLIAANLIDY